MQERHVQTTLPDHLYEGLRAEARRRRQPLKDVLRAAVEEYLRQVPSTIPEADSLLGFVGKGSLPQSDWSTRKDWRA